MVQTQSAIKTQGTLVRTKRAFQEDVETVMGNDPIRAIIELVTNADDAYFSSQPSKRAQPIRIEVARRRSSPTEIRILDRAIGMDRNDLVQKLGHEGGMESGFQDGADVRGLLGRGAKDVVHFGPVSWTSTKHKATHRFSLLHENGRPTDKYEIEAVNSKSSNRSGTAVSLLVQPRFKIPQQRNLTEMLRRHYQLRPLLVDKTRRVTLGDGSEQTETLEYQYPTGKSLIEQQEFEIMKSKDIRDNI